MRTNISLSIEVRSSELLKKIKLFYAPKHGSWLNIAEIEINIMDRQCTGERIESKEKLISNVMIWSKERNDKQCNIEWKFTRQGADDKPSKHYVA